MDSPFEQALIEVWRQALVENAKTVILVDELFPVRRTPKRGLRQLDFTFEGNEVWGLEQNPRTKSRWARMARSGKKVMQFLSGGATWRMWWMGRWLYTPGGDRQCPSCAQRRLQARATLAAWFGCGMVVRRSPRLFGPPVRGIVGLAGPLGASGNA